VQPQLTIPRLITVGALCAVAFPALAGLDCPGPGQPCRPTPATPIEPVPPPRVVMGQQWQSYITYPGGRLEFLPSYYVSKERCEYDLQITQRFEEGQHPEAPGLVVRCTTALAN
jgi:hypothetical protein